MIIKYGSLAYFIWLLISFGLTAIPYFLLRNKTERAKRLVIVIFIFLNLFQHIFKSYVWRHLYGRGFTRENTAYNMCALLIIITPLAYFLKSETLKNYVGLVGSFAGFIAVVIPYWFIGKSAFTWESVRFYTCHALLLATSSLPLLFGIYKIRFKHFYKIAICFFISILIINLNNGLILQAQGVKDVISSLKSENVIWCAHPVAIFDGLEKVFASPFFFKDKGGEFIPILWYFIPMYLFITLSAFIISVIADKEGFKEFKSKVKSK